MRPREALKAFGAPYVVKDDALAAGKGVVVTEDFSVALAHAASCQRVLSRSFWTGRKCRCSPWPMAGRPCVARGAGLQGGA